MVLKMEGTFEVQLAALINSYSMENESNTPDFILASYMKRCLDAFNEAVQYRDNWYGINPQPGGPQ